MVVMKFGGSSIADSEKIKNVCEIVKSRLNQKPILVLSAVGGITNKLLELTEKKDLKILDEIIKKHKKILKELELNEKILDEPFEELEKSIKEKTNLKILDKVQSFGERASVKIVAEYLNKIGISAKAINSYDIGMLTNSDFGKAEFLENTQEKLKKNLQNLSEIPVITGFIAKDLNGEITTLGRGGSDYTAAIIGAALEKPIEIWTDVNGIMTADPRIVKNAKTIERIDFNEAAELAYFGAKVLHPKTIWPAIQKNLPVRVLNSFEPESKGTTILKEDSKETPTIKAISCKKKIIIIDIKSTRMLMAYGFLVELFSIFKKYKKVVDVISTSEVSVSLTIDNEENLEEIKKELEKIAKIEIKKQKSIICIIGEKICEQKNKIAEIFEILKDVKIDMVSMGASKINISLVIDEKETEEVVQRLHKKFFE